MELQYRLMHWLRITPWDREETPEPLVRLVSGPDALATGTALDLGCGSGRHAAILAAHGWRVHGVDVSASALARARGRTEAVSWHLAGLGDSRMLAVARQLEGRVSLVLDVGCLHGLSPTGRQDWAATVTAVAAPDAVVLVRAEPPARSRGIGPRGIAAGEIGRLLPYWDVLPESEPPWYQLRRRRT